MWLYIQFVLLGVFWGGSFIAIKFALVSIPFALAVLFRIAIGMVFLVAAAFITKKPVHVPRAVLPWVWLNGLLSIGVPFLFLFWAEQNVSAGIAGIMNGSVPIWTALFGFIFLKEFESASRKKVSGIVLGLVGVITIFLPTVLKNGTHTSPLGLLALLGMALLYSSGALLAKKLISGASQVPVFGAALHQHFSSLIVVVLFCIISGQSFSTALWQPSSIWAVAYLGIFSTGLAFLMFFGLVAVWGPVKASMVTYLIPTVCLVLDYSVFNNIPAWNELLGMCIVFVGILVAQKS